MVDDTSSTLEHQSPISSDSSQEQIQDDDDQPRIRNRNVPPLSHRVGNCKGPGNGMTEFGELTNDSPSVEEPESLVHSLSDVKDAKANELLILKARIKELTKGTLERSETPIGLKAIVLFLYFTLH